MIDTASQNVLRKEYDKPKWEHSAPNIKIKNAQKTYKYSTNANSKIICCEAWFWADINLCRLSLTILHAPGAGLCLGISCDCLWGAGVAL